MPFSSPSEASFIASQICFVGRGLRQVDRQVNDGDVQRGNAHGHTGQLAVQLGDDLADGLGGAGGRLGMMLPAAARPPRQSFMDGPSTVFWVAVVE